MDGFEYFIEKEIGVMSNNKGYSKELNLVSFNKKEATYDIRNWYTDPDTGDKKMMKGISLKKEEVIKLREFLNSLNL